MKTKQELRQRRQKGIRKQISGSEATPRLAVFRSNKHIYAQLINDDASLTIVSASDTKIAKGTPVEKAEAVGKEIAKLAMAKKITKVVFDRAGYKYHGRVKSLADGARAGGLQF